MLNAQCSMLNAVLIITELSNPSNYLIDNDFIDETARIKQNLKYYIRYSIFWNEFIWFAKTFWIAWINDGFYSISHLYEES
jgi:hypothetical protein